MSFIKIKGLTIAYMRASSIIVLSLFLLAKPGRAAILSLDNSNAPASTSTGTEIPGTGTLDMMGFNMTPVTDSTQNDGDIVTSLPSVDGPVTFCILSSPGPNSSCSSQTPNNPIKGTVPTTFLTWSRGYQGPVYMFTDYSTSIILPPGVRAFDFYAQPNSFGSSVVQAHASDGSTTDLPQDVNGLFGAKYYGFYVPTGDPTTITSITFLPSANPGIPPAFSNTNLAAAVNPDNALPADVLAQTQFAVGQLRIIGQTVPEPSEELGTLVFGLLGAGYLLRHQWKKAQTR